MLPSAAPLNSLGFPKPSAQTRVVVAMSGGVDSSVVAASLAAEGQSSFWSMRCCMARWPIVVTALMAWTTW